MVKDVNRRRFISTGAAGLAASGIAHARTAPFAPKATDADEAVFAAARRQFLFPRDVTYCNTGTLGASPREVMDALIDGQKRIEEQLPAWDYEQESGGPLTGYQELPEIRKQAAAFINARGHDEIALTQNATMGMSFVAAGLKLEPGDEILTTDQEHGGGVSGWRLRAQRSGVVLKELDLAAAVEDGPDAVVAMFANAVTPKTRVIMFSHITSLYGALLPAKELCALAREVGALSVVDGAQSMGQMRIDVQDLDCDVFISSPHKWLLAPKGTGVLYLRREIQDRIWTTLASAQFENYEAGAYRFMQYGTGSVPVVEGLSAAFRFISKIGIDRVERWDRALTQRLRDGLAQIKGVRLNSPADPHMAAAATTFHIEGTNGKDVQDALWAREKIRVRGYKDEIGVRLTAHLYVNPSDIDHVLNVVESLA